MISLMDRRFQPLRNQTKIIVGHLPLCIEDESVTIRKNYFCSIVTGNDYLDIFEQG
jgi:hypothetical protein